MHISLWAAECTQRFTILIFIFLQGIGLLRSIGKVLDLEDGSVSKGPNKYQTLLSVFLQLRSWQAYSKSEQQQSLALAVPLETLVHYCGIAGEIEAWIWGRIQVREMPCLHLADGITLK